MCFGFLTASSQPRPLTLPMMPVLLLKGFHFQKLFDSYVLHLPKTWAVPPGLWG